MYRVLIAAVAVVAGCKNEGGEVGGSQPQPQPKPAQIEPTACMKAKQEHGAMAWIADDYDSALSCAKSKNLPIVLDLWAPWCHTCLSMQTTVFADKSFAERAPKFVWVALDTDRDVNAAAVAKFPPSAWPTFYVIGPDEHVLARFVGAASIAQFHAFLDTGLRVRQGGVAGADARLLAAERHLAAKQIAEAEKELVAALAEAPKEWVRRSDALVSLLGARLKLKDFPGCMTLAEQSLDDTGNAASASDFLGTAVTCAKEVEKTDAERVKKLRERAVARWQKLLDDPSAPLSTDDRSDAMLYLRETLVELGQKDAGTAIAEKQRALLDDAAAKATTPTAAMTYNWHRAEVYVFLGRPLEVVPALEKSAKDLPNEYDPRARLGWVYFKADKLAEAAKWTDEAVKLAYGPRKTRVLSLRADIAAKAGDKAAERKAREDIVKTFEAMPASQVPPDALAKAKRAVADLDKPAADKKPPATK